MRSVERHRAPAVTMVRSGAWTARVTPWPMRSHVAHLVAVPGQRPPEAAQVEHVLHDVRELGYVEVLSAAMAPHEHPPYEAAGFAVVERLHLLHLALDDLPAPPPESPRRSRIRRRDWDAVVALDHRAFPPFWRLDVPGLLEAVRATPSTRLRIVLVDGGPAGYAITGRSAGRGYVQRLAVEPSLAGRGIGSALLLDGLHWLRVRGTVGAVVNTQLGNDRALELYQRHGFRLAGHDLAVLGRSLDLR